MSHSLRVELARFMSMEALTKSVLFGSCGDGFLTDICVLVREINFVPRRNCLCEMNFVPEEIVYNSGDSDACKKMFAIMIAHCLRRTRTLNRDLPPQRPGTLFAHSSDSPRP